MRVARTYLVGHKAKIALAVVAALIVAAATSLATWVVQPGVNDILHGNLSQLYQIAAVMVGLGILRAVAQIVQSWMMNTVGHRIVGQIQTDLFGRVIRSDLARLRGEHTGSFVSAMLYDASLLRNAATSALLTYFQNLVMVIGLLTVMLLQRSGADAGHHPGRAAAGLPDGPLHALVQGRRHRRDEGDLQPLHRDHGGHRRRQGGQDRQPRGL